MEPPHLQGDPQLPLTSKPPSQLWTTCGGTDIASPCASYSTVPCVVKEDSTGKRGVTNSLSSQRRVGPSAQLLTPIPQPFVDFCSLFMAEKRPKDTLCGPGWAMGGRGEGHYNFML